MVSWITVVITESKKKNMLEVIFRYFEIWLQLWVFIIECSWLINLVRHWLVDIMVRSRSYINREWSVNFSASEIDAYTKQVLNNESELGTCERWKWSDLLMSSDNPQLIIETQRDFTFFFIFKYPAKSHLSNWSSRVCMC